LEEKNFYRDDIEFMRWHKRTTRNISRALEEVLTSNHQTVQGGIKMQNQISLEYVKCNRKCTLIHVWWGLINTNPTELDEDLVNMELKERI
jgi:hypothetical protein